jgi:bifunctional ADP-heptose synthase (sugar kinase/adenylyltransferase)
LAVKCNDYEVCKPFYPDLEGKPDIDTVVDCGSRLYEKNGHPVFVTMGAEGIMTFGGKGVTVVPTEDVPRPYDICGAGDSVAASVASSLAAGADEVEAAFIGNITAGTTIRKIGMTGTATPEEVLETYDGWFRGTKPWRR